MVLLAVIRIKGEVDTSKDERMTMKLLNLDRKNHCSLFLENSALKGMLRKVRHLITWGEINEKTFAKLLKKRARLKGNKRIDEKMLKEMKFNSYEDLAKALMEGKASLRTLGIKKVFRLNSPTKGFERKGIKLPFQNLGGKNIGGAYGYRGEKINDLLNKMM
jgi:large subunit ribosomal protein L30